MLSVPHETPEQIAWRITEFERTKRPDALWPGLGERARVAAARELARITRLVLGGAETVSLDAPSSHSAYALGVAGHTTGMGPVVGRWIETGRVVATPDVAAVFLEHLDQSRRRGVRMQGELIPALDALHARGITPLVLKGFHTARVCFDEPGARRMMDVDLLVPANQVDAAEAALAGAGFTPQTAALRPYKRDWMGPDVDPRHHSVTLAHEHSPWILELHASLDRVHHPGTVVRLNAALRSVERLSIDGREVLVLAAAPLVVYLACHCSQELDGIRLLRLFELVRLIRSERARQRFDWNEVLALLYRTGAARFAYPALALVEDLAAGTIDARVLALGYRESTWAACRTVARLAPGGGSLDASGIMRQLMWTRGPVSVATRLLRNLWPASFARPRDVLPGWRVRLRRLLAGDLSLDAPNERDERD